MSSIASTVVQMTGASLSQQIGTAVARQQITAQRAVADLVAQGVATAPTGAPAPAGQGQTVDLRV